MKKSIILMTGILFHKLLFQDTADDKDLPVFSRTNKGEKSKK